MKRFMGILLVLCILLCACTSASIGEHSEKLPYGEAYYVTDEEKEKWREPLLEILSRMHYFGRDSASDDSTIFIMPYLSVSLFDMNCDGTPEVIVNQGGGSMQNALYEVYDLATGECMGNFDGSFEDSRCYYYDLEEKDYDFIGQSSWRIGYDSRFRFISMMGESDDLIDCILSEDYNLPNRSENWEEEIFNVTYSIDGELATIDQYYAAYDALWQRYVRIPDTQMAYIYWSDLEGYDAELEPSSLAEQMADALLRSGQKFIALD
ncbi:MAG: hypothetical protein IJY39_00295 [Clostridia bacterium]|nr:hypothetical protein [Clostridia bacterium]